MVKATFTKNDSDEEDGISTINNLCGQQLKVHVVAKISHGEAYEL